MLELASLGSKVLQTRSVEFAGNYQVPTRVLSSLTDPLMPLAEEASSGTLISFEEESNMEQAVISGIAFNRDEAKITVLGVPDKPGVAFHILGPIAEANIEVDMIIQNQSVDGKTDFTFTVSRNDYVQAMKVLEDQKDILGAAKIVGDAKVSKVSAVGVGMRSHVGVASDMFRTLSEEGINIQMISTSEIKISVLIDEKYMELAVRALHKSFNLEQS
jgi:aspartate kinase